MKKNKSATLRATLAILALCSLTAFGGAKAWASTAVSGVGTTDTFNVGGASATGDNSTAVGDGASATGNASIAIGSGRKSTTGDAENPASAVGEAAIAIGADSVANGTGSIAIGLHAATGDIQNGMNMTAIGMHAVASNIWATALGASSLASGTDSISIGDSVASGTYAIAIGDDSGAKTDGSVALGGFAFAGASEKTQESDIDSSKTYATAIGWCSEATGKNSVALGSESVVSEENTVSVGRAEVKTDGVVTKTAITRKITNAAAGDSANDAAVWDQIAAEVNTTNTVNQVNLSTDARDNLYANLGKKNEIVANDGTVLARFTASTASSLSSADTGFVSGAVLYDEVRPAEGKYVHKTSTTA